MLLVVILSRWVCFSPSTMASFHRQCCWFFVFVFGGGLLIAHECDHSFESLITYELLCWKTILLPYTPPRKPFSGLVLCSGNDAVDGDRSCSDTAPLFPLLAAGGPPVKNRPGSLYDGAALIVPEYGNTWGIWLPPCCVHHVQVAVHATTSWKQSHTPNLFFQTDKSIRRGRQFRKCVRLHRMIAASPQAGATAPPRRWQDPPKFTYRSSGCESPVDCYILRFLRHSSSQMSVTAPSNCCFSS